MIKKLIPVILVFLLAACAGQKIKADQLSQVQRGVTTKAQLVQMFGEPTETTMMGDGRETLSYFYKSPFEGRAKGVVFPLDNKAIVTDYIATGL